MFCSSAKEQTRGSFFYFDLKKIHPKIHEKKILQEDADATSADGRRKQYRKQRTVQSWEFEAEGDIAQPEFLVNL